MITPGLKAEKYKQPFETYVSNPDIVKPAAAV
jgi:hypothetical protein